MPPVKKTREKGDFSSALILEEKFFRSFDKKIRSVVCLNLLFCLALLVEVFFILFFFFFLIKTALLAIAIGSVIFTLFVYGMIKQFLDMTKLAHFESLCKELFIALENSVLNENEMEKHVTIAKVFCRYADRFYQREYSYYPLPKLLNFLSPLNEKLSSVMHWRDVHKIRELLLQAAVAEHLKLVRKEPANPDAHALLANAYVMLSGLYLDPRKLLSEDAERWIPAGKLNAAFSEKFKMAAQKAVEEFKILQEYAPCDPWVFSQLAYSYRDLQMPNEEKMAYEAILELCPQDYETRFKLGALYFQHGENAKGLKAYEELKKAHYHRADELLVNYGREWS